MAMDKGRTVESFAEVGPGGGAQAGPIQILTPLEIGLLRLQVFTSFAAAEATWRSAEENCFCHVFQSFDWLSTWHETIGTAENVKPCIVHVVDRRGKTVMLWPLGTRRLNGLSFLNFLGGVVTDYHAPLIARDFAGFIDPAAVAALLARFVAAVPRVDVVAFDRMPASLGTSNPLSRLPGARHVWSAHLAHLPPSFEEFKKTRSGKLFSDSARRWRRLSEFGEPQIVLTPSREAQDAILEALSRQKSRRWREAGAQDLFALPGYFAFYRTLVEKFTASGLVHLSAITVGGTIVATHLGAVHRGRFYYLMPSYEAGEWGRYAVGRLLMQALVKWSIEAGLHVFDFTVGDEPFKAQWADLSVPLYDYQRGVTIAGGLFSFCMEAGERIRAQAKRSERLRGIVRRLRARL